MPYEGISETMSKKVFIHYVRHGTTLFNRIGRMQGWSDSPLEEEGISQAREARETLKDIPFRKAYTSTSERCVDTAHIILEGRDVPLVYTKKLKEISWGDYDGFLISNDPREIDRRRFGDCDWTDVGGENPGIAIARAKEVYDQIYEESRDGDHILVVSHGAIMIHMMEKLMGIDLNRLFTIMQRKGQTGSPVSHGYAADIMIEDGAYHLLDLRGQDGLYEEYRKETMSYVKPYHV